MNTSPPTPPIDQYLVLVNSRDRVGDFIKPSPEAKHRIESELEHLSGAKVSSLANTEDSKEVRAQITAFPGNFLGAALAQIEIFGKVLKDYGASEFEVAFHNIQTQENAWGDRVFFAIRYRK